MIQFILVVQGRNFIDEQNYNSSAISRYCKYVLNEEKLDYCSYISKTATNQKECVDTLLDCCKFLESKIDDIESKGVLLALNYHINNFKFKHIQSNYILSLTEVLSNNNDIWKALGKIRTEIKEAMNWCYFNQALDAFRHGQNSDIVNSDLGLLKVYLDNNYISFTKDSISEEIIKNSVEIIKELQKSINNYESIYALITYNTKIKDNLEYCNYIIDNIIDIFENSEIDIIKNNDDIKRSLSLYISELYSKISYHNK